MEKNVAKMKVSDLRAALAKRDLSTEGLKVDLVHRLQARLDEEEFGMDDIAPPVSTSTDAATVIESPVLAVEEVASPPKESAISPLVKAADDPAPEEKEDEIANNKPEDAGITITPKTKEKEKLVPAVSSREEKKDSISSTPATVNETPKKKLTFEEMKAARAKRFGIPVHKKKLTQEERVAARAKRFATPAEIGDKKKQKTSNPSKGSNDNAKSGHGTKASKTKTPETTLTKKEIEQRIKRIGRFGESTSSENLKKLDELKSMLRLHRFTKETEA